MKPTQIRSGYSPGKTWYEISGSCSDHAPVVLIHGVGLDSDMWSPQVKKLNSSFQVVRYDILGHGRTKSSNINGIASFISQLVELLIFLKIKKIHLVGLSLGGVIAQGFAKDYPEKLQSLVLMNTVYQRTEVEKKGMRNRLIITRNEGLEAIADAAIDRWFDSKFKIKYPHRIKEIHDKLVQNNKQNYIEAYSALLDSDQEIGSALQTVKCPALIMTGEKDIGSTPQIAQRMAKDLKKARVIILPGLHHLSSFENPLIVNEQLESFFNDVNKSK